MTDLQHAYEYAASAPARVERLTAAQAWAQWFDVLREHQAAARKMHPLRIDELFEEEGV